MKTELTIKNAIGILFEIIFVSISAGVVVINGLLLLFGALSVELNQVNGIYLTLISLTLITTSYAVYRVKLYRKMECWELSSGVIKRGSPVNLEVEIKSVSNVTLGFPKPKWHKFIHGGRSKGLLASLYEHTLILKLDGNQFLPLYLFRFGGAAEIMSEMYSWLEDRIDKDYEYSQEERRLLKPRIHNRLVRL